MQRMTERDAFRLARAYRKIAAKLDDYVDDNFDTLAPFDRYRLMRQEGLIEQAAIHLTWSGAVELLDELGDSVQTIQQATEDVSTALDRLDDVRDVLGAATAAVQFVAALFTQDYGGAISHANELGKQAAKLAGRTQPVVER